ncbi:MAG: alcohol dehydrogenase catalytic domain-containing protein [Candidatus Gastranaerophilales bacterium]|nr:alcohol dehydrogenase catalytic domain-containing protein [Candidatus Gastranaerophilales bacterium]
MKCAKLVEGEIKIIETEVPKLTSKGAIIKVIGCGLCGSDLVKIKHAKLNPDTEVVLGHEVVGEIVQIDSQCDFKVGDIVALGHHYPCFECEYCKNESYSMCRTFKRSNIYPAGFCEYIRVDENHLKYTVYKMNKDLTYDEMAFLEPLSCCIRAVRRAGFKYGEDNSKYSSLVIGLGSIGYLMTKALSAFKVSAYGFDLMPERARLANFNLNKKYDCVFLTAGSSRAIESALKYVIDGGKIIVFSSVENDLKGFNNNDIYYRELSVIASYSPAPCDIKLSADFLNSKKINVEGLSKYYPLDNLALAVDDSFNNKTYKAYIKI